MRVEQMFGDKVSGFNRPVTGFEKTSTVTLRFLQPIIQPERRVPLEPG